MTEYKYVGSKIKVYRKKRGLSQNELAKQIGKSLRSIQKYESGEVIPTDETIKDIADALSIDVYDLLNFYRSDFLQTLSDVKAVIVELSETLGIQFDIDINRPHRDGTWSCSIHFNGNDKNALYNYELCRFLETLAREQEALEHQIIDRMTYEQWIRLSMFETESIKLQKREYKRLSWDEYVEFKKQQSEKFYDFSAEGKED